MQGERKGDAAETKDAKEEEEEEEEMVGGRRKVGGRCLEIRKEIRGGDGREGREREGGKEERRPGREGDTQCGKRETGC